MHLKIFVTKILLLQLANGLSISQDEALRFNNPFLFANSPRFFFPSNFALQDNGLQQATYPSSDENAEDIIPFRPQLVSRSELPQHLREAYVPNHLRGLPLAVKPSLQTNNVYQEPSISKVPPKYAFDYYLQDDYSGNHFGHQETRDGHHTHGSYFVNLPDGRKQIVKYQVVGNSGYNAEVTYEGEARYAEPHRKTNRKNQYRVLKKEPLESNHPDDDSSEHFPIVPQKLRLDYLNGI